MLLIQNGMLITMDGPAQAIADGVVLVDGPRIVYAGPRQDAPPAQGAQVLDAKGGLIMPGLINCHAHTAMTLVRGLADDLPLAQWLNEHIFPVEAKLDGQAVHWGTMLGCLEMIRGGVTCFNDMYLFAHDVGRAVERSGLRAVIGEVLYDFPSPCYGPLENGFKVCAELIEHYKDHPRIKGAVVTHALYTCSRPLMERAGRLAADAGVDLVIHLAETTVENELVLEKWGRRPYEVMEELGLCGPNLLIDHAVHLSDAEIRRAAAAGVRVAHCPESNMKLASGVMPLRRMLAAGLTVGLATDGCASNNNLDMFEEMDSCAKLCKVSTMDPTAAPAAQVLALATSQAGAAMGMAGQIGVLKAGALADVIVIDTDQPHLTPMYNPVSHLVYAARAADVMHTICHGQVLMQDRQLTTIDQDEVLRNFRRCADALTGGKLL